MKPKRILTIFSVLAIVLFAASSAFAVTMTVETTAGRMGHNVPVPIIVDNPAQIAGAAFTLKYNTSALSVDVTSTFFDTFARQFAGTAAEGTTSVAVNGETYDQPLIANPFPGTGMWITAGRVMPADASSDRTLFILNVTLKAGKSSGTYPITVVPTALDYTRAGYGLGPDGQAGTGDDTPETVNLLVGIDLNQPSDTASAYPVIIDDDGYESHVSNGSVTFTPGGSFTAGRFYTLENMIWTDTGTSSTNYMIHFDGTNLNVSRGGTIYNEGAGLILHAESFESITSEGRGLSATAGAGNVYSVVFGALKLLLRINDAWVPGNMLEFAFLSGGAARSINGRVTATDKPEGVVGSWVDAWSQSTGSFLGTSSDEDGYYSITGLSSADDFVVAAWPPQPVEPETAPPEYERLFYNGKATGEEATRVSTFDGDAVGIDFMLQKASLLGIAGRVHDGAGSGISNISVDVWSDSAWFGLSTLTDAAGNYTITGLKPANDYRVSVWSDTLNTEMYYKTRAESTPLWDQAILVPLDDDPPTPNIDIVIKEGAAIEGRVTRADGVTPVPNVWVNAWSDGLMIGNGSTTDSSGYYKIVGLVEVKPEDAATNGYLVDTSHRRYPYQAYDNAPDPESATLLDAPRNGVDFKLKSGAAISGVVKDPDGKPVNRVWVEAWSPSTGSVGGADSGLNTDETLNDTGAYFITNLPPAKCYVVSVWPPDYPGGYWAGNDKPVVDDSDDAVCVDLTSGDKAGIDFTLSKGALIKGAVYIASEAAGSEAPAGIMVDVWSESTGTGGSVPTDPDGRYEVAGLDSGAADYIISIWHKPYLPSFYNSGGTTNDWNNAQKVAPSSDPVQLNEYRNLVLSAGYSIKGKVTLNDRPVAGIFIDAWAPDVGYGFTESRGTLSIDGKYNYEITGLPGGTYEVTIHPTNFISQTQSDVVVAGEDVTDKNFTIALDPGRNISGTISGLGSGEKAWISAWSRTMVFSNETSVTGTGNPVSYTITGLKPASDYRIGFISFDCPSQVHDGKIDVSDNDASGIDFTVSAGTAISGTVFFPEGAQTGEKVCVDAFSETAGFGGSAQVIATAGAGPYDYEIGGLAPFTDYVVATFSDKYKNVFYDGVSNFENASKIDTSDTIDDSDVDFTLSEGANISGTVTNEDGSPAKDVWTDAWSEKTGSWAGASTDANGVYLITGLDAAIDFTVAAHKENAPLFFYHVDSNGNIQTVRMRERATPVSTADGDRTGIDIVLSEGKSISGTVRNKVGKALSGIWVDARSEAKQAGSGAFTDQGGAYLIQGLPAGNDYKVSLWPDPSLGYTPQSKENVSAGDTAVDFTLSTGHTISGVVRNHSGAAIGYAWVEIWSLLQDFYGWAETNNSGNYSIGGLPAASDYVIVAKPPENQACVPYCGKGISIGGDTTKDITLTQAFSIRGHVYESDGMTGISGVEVAAFSASKDFFGIAATDSQGAYEIKNLPGASDYEVTARPSNHAKQTKAGQSAGDIVDFTLATGGSIKGTVKDKGGSAIEGAWVEAGSASVSSALGGAVTDKEGKYEIIGLKGADSQGATLDDYVVTVAAEGYPPQSQSGKSVADEVDFTLSAGDANKIYGTVRDASDPPDTTFASEGDQIAVMQVQIYEKAESGGFVKRARVNNDGTFEVTGLKSNTEYQVQFKVWKTGYADQYREWAGARSGDHYPGQSDRPADATLTTGASLGSVDVKFSKTWAGFWGQ